MWIRRLQRLSGMVRLVAIVILLAIIGFIGFQVYDFYRDKVGFTPVAAVDLYFSELAAQNYDAVYDLTSKANLTDIYGRPITKGEFIAQLRRITNDQPMPLSDVEAVKLYGGGNAYYYAVTLHSQVGGEPSTARLIVEVVRQDRSWLVTYPFGIVL